MAQATSQLNRVVDTDTPPKRDFQNELEDLIMHCLRAADISASLLEHAVSHQPADLGLPDGCVYFPNDAQGNLIWASYQVVDRAKDLQKFLEEPWSMVATSEARDPAA